MQSADTVLGVLRDRVEHEVGVAPCWAHRRRVNQIATAIPATMHSA